MDLIVPTAKLPGTIMQSNTQKEMIQLKELLEAVNKEKDSEKKDQLCQQLIKLIYG